MTDHHFKLANETRTKNMPATTVATIILNNWISSYRIPAKLLTENCLQFTSKFFKANCVELGNVPLTTTEYHSHSNGQVERFNSTIASRLHHDNSEHQQDCGSSVMLLTYAYNMQVHHATKLPPFSLVLGRQTSTPGTTTQQPVLLDFNQINFLLALKIWLKCRAIELKQVAEKNLQKSQRRLTLNQDRKVHFKQIFAPINHVFVERLAPITTSVEPLALDNYFKLRARRLCPYRIISVGPVFLETYQDGITNTSSINRVTLRTPLDGPATTTQPNQG